MKLRKILLPMATIGLAATPILTATSCAKYDHYFFTVTNNKGLEVEFSDLGAGIANLKLGNTYLTYHPKSRETFINPSHKPYWHGKLLGRVTGRFKDAKFTMDGKEYQLQLNEKSDTKNNTLHGGFDALSFKEFKHEIKEDNDGYNVIFTYTSPDGEAGFPGELKVTATYKIYKNENKIDTILEAVPNKKTLINLSTHSLFRLGNDGDVLNYRLHIPGTKRVVYDKEAEMKTGQIPTGTKGVSKADAPEDLGIYDFTGEGSSAKKIGKDIYASAVRDPISNGYDHIWYCGDILTTARYVNLFNPKNGVNFKVQATNDNVTGFILYANDYPCDGWIMSDGYFDTQYAGITIEPYTYFTANDLSPITYGPDEAEGHKVFKTSYSYEISQLEPEQE